MFPREGIIMAYQVMGWWPQVIRFSGVLGGPLQWPAGEFIAMAFQYPLLPTPPLPPLIFTSPNWASGPKFIWPSVIWDQDGATTSDDSRKVWCWKHGFWITAMVSHCRNMAVTPNSPMAIYHRLKCSVGWKRKHFLLIWHFGQHVYGNHSG